MKKNKNKTKGKRKTQKKRKRKNSWSNKKNTLFAMMLEEDTNPCTPFHNASSKQVS